MSYFHLVFVRDEGHKGKNSVLANMPFEVKIQKQYPNTREFIKEGYLNIAYSVMAFVVNKGQLPDLVSSSCAFST